VADEKISEILYKENYLKRLMSDLIRYGQEHLLAHWDTLTEDEKKNLYNEIKVKLTLFNICSTFFLIFA
jgi:hypothetical protein